MPGNQYLPAKEDAPAAPVVVEQADEPTTPAVAPNVDDAPITPTAAAEEQSDGPTKVQLLTSNDSESTTVSLRSLIDIRETQPSTTQVVQSESTASAPTTSAPEVPLETTTLDKILSRQYFTPLLKAQSVQEEQSVAVEAKVVQPSHTYTENDGYNYKLPANSFTF